MNIVHVIPGLTCERGGPTAVVEALVRHQAQSGHTVRVVTTDQGARHGERPVELHSAVEVIRLAVRGPDRLAFAPGFGRAVRRCLADAEVVHVHSIFTYPVHAAIREAARARVPVILRPCGLLHRYSLQRSRWRKRLYLALWGAMVRAACTVWHYTSEQESAESWPADQSRRFVLPNGIEAEEFALDRSAAQDTVARRWPELAGARYVLFLGRLHPKKRLDLLLEAFLRGAPADCKLAVAGPDEGKLWPGLAARFLRDPVCALRVVRLGTVEGADKRSLLAGASLFALPSEHENFGVAPLEALASGTRVLLSPHVDLAAAVVGSGWGETAPLHLPAWSDRLAAMLRENCSAEQTDKLRRWVKERYGWGRIAAALEEQYRALGQTERALSPTAG